MKAITVEPKKPGSARLEDVPEPDVRNGEVLVEAIAVGVCGTDVEIVEGKYGWCPPGKTRLAPDWGDTSHSLAATLRCDADGLRLHIMVNAYWEPLGFALPLLEGDFGSWRCCVDTLRASPADIRTVAEADPVSCPTFTVQPRSLAVLAARRVPPTHEACA
jgi:hypothetical protein